MQGAEGVGPKVSIVMPVFNGGAYFELAVQSALAQTYANIEIVLVDDGSTDEGATDAICRRFAQAHPEVVRHIKQANTGVAGALNAGIAAAEGDIFCWLSHDDLFEPDKTQRQVDFHRRLGRADAILISDYRLIDPEGATLHEIRLPHAQAAASPRLPLFKGWVNGCTIFAPIHLLGPEPFDLSYRYVQDYRLWSRLVRDHEIYHQPEMLVRYRLHPTQDSKKPQAIAEGDALWIDMIESCGPAVRAQLSGSSWCFYEEARLHLEGAAYDAAVMRATTLRDQAITGSLVSVIVPVFNEPDLALRAFVSVQAQTHRNLQIILIDDGSTASLDALREAVAAEPRAQIVRQDNAGPGAARNHGVRLARGEYIAFLDSDDVFLDEKIERQLEAMQQAGALFSHTSYFVTYPERREDVGMLHSGAFSGRVYPAILGGCPIAMPTVMIHRLVVAEGFRFAEDTRLSEDVLTWIDLAVRHPLLGLDDPLSVVEWSDATAATDGRKALQGAERQLEVLETDPIHFRKPELSRLRSLVGELRERQRGVAGSGPDEGLMRAAFPPGGTQKRAELRPRHAYPLETFIKARRPAEYGALTTRSTLTQGADAIVEKGWRPRDLDLHHAENNIKARLASKPGEVSCSMGETPWAYAAAVALQEGSIAAVEAVLRSRERVYVLLVDAAYEQVGARQVVEAGRAQTCWFELGPGDAPQALVIQASDAPRGLRADMIRVTAYCLPGA